MFFLLMSCSQVGPIRIQQQEISLAIRYTSKDRDSEGFCYESLEEDQIHLLIFIEFHQFISLRKKNPICILKCLFSI